MQSVGGSLRGVGRCRSFLTFQRMTCGLRCQGHPPRPGTRAWPARGCRSGRRSCGRPTPDIHPTRRAARPGAPTDYGGGGGFSASSFFRRVVLLVLIEGAGAVVVIVERGAAVAAGGVVAIALVVASDADALLEVG